MRSIQSLATKRAMGLSPVGLARLWFAVVCGPAAACLGSPSLPDSWFFPNRPAGLMELEGRRPPDLQLDEWIGEKVSLTETRGKVVVIDFWATWCGPCMAAIPENVKIAEKYKDQGLVIIGVHDAKSGWEKAPDVVREKKITYPVAVDKKGGVSAKAFGLAFWPTYVIVDRQGLVRGAGLNPRHLGDAVKLLLGESGGGGGGSASRWPPANWFYGGERRPWRLRSLEGKPMPALSVAEWLGEPLTPADCAERVVVLHFLASGNRLSMTQAESLAGLEREMGPQGVVVVGVCGSSDAWDALKGLARQGKLPSRLCSDRRIEKPRALGGTDGGSAAAFGVRYLPCTIVVDRAGVVRGAGVRVERIKEIAGKLLAERGKPQENAAAMEKRA